MHQITVKNVHLYCDEKLLSVYGKDCVRIVVQNILPTTEYRNIVVKDIFLNGVKLPEHDMTVSVEGCEKDILTVRS